LRPRFAVRQSVRDREGRRSWPGVRAAL